MKFSAKQQDKGCLCLFRKDYYIIPLAPFTLKLMRISILILFSFLTSMEILLAFPAKGQDIAATTVSVGLSKEPFTTAIKKIEKQTTFRFYYKKIEIDELQQLSLPFASRTIEQTLQELLKNTGFSFKQVNQSIIIERKKEGKEADRKISGRLYLENAKEPVAYALIELLNKNDSLLVGHGYSDPTGSFGISTNSSSRLLLRVSGLGFQVFTTEVAEGGDQTLEAIFLKQTINQLKEVTVSAGKPFIQRKTDRFVVNVDKSGLNQNDNVWDVLKQVPLVNANDDGALSIISKQSAIVYINGRKSNLSGNALFNYLKSLPSTTLSDVEIITTPGSEFDASGNAGIINMVFKKRESDGYQGSISVSDAQANYNSQITSGSFNYRNGKFGLNFTPYYNRNRKLFTERHTTDFSGSNTNQLLNQSNLDRHQFRNFYGGNMGLEYNINRAQQLSATINYNLNKQTHNSIEQSSYINKSNMAVDSSFVFTNNKKIKGHLIDLGLNYLINLDSLGQSLNLSGDFFDYLEETDQKTYATQDGTNQIRRDEISILPQKVKSYTFAADYKLPLDKNVSLKLGARSFNTYTDNNLYYAVASNGVYIKDELRTTNYEYEEHVHALYSGLDYNLGKGWALTAGLRLEQSNTKGKELIHNEIAVDRRYLNVFPALSINFNANEDNTFSYSLSKRISRPDFWQLNTLRTYSNPTQYIVGNPFLQPSYILKNEFSYTLKNKFIFLLDYSRITDDFEQFMLVNNTDNVTKVIWLNYGAEHNASISAILNYNPFAWLQSSVTAIGAYTKYVGEVEGETINTEGFSGNFKMNNTIKISKEKGLTGTVNLNYSTPMVHGFGTNSKIKAMGSLNVGLRKIYKQFTFTLTGTDLLRTSARRFEINSLLANRTSRNYWDSRSIMFNVSFNFGNNKLKQNKVRENISKDVINRTGN